MASGVQAIVDQGLVLGWSRWLHVAQREAARFEEDDLLHHTP